MIHATSIWQRSALALVTVCGLALPACESDGHFSIFGYSTRPNYDCTIRTVRVPIFKNNVVQDTVRRGEEFDLTEAVIREIEKRTPFKVVGANCDADTELMGIIVNNPKQLLNRTQRNTVREGEVLLSVEIVWRNLRTGEVLSQPKKKGPPPDPATLVGPQPPPPPLLVQSKASFIPELGGSFTTARQQNVELLAKQIVYMMEKPW